MAEVAKVIPVQLTLLMSISPLTKNIVLREDGKLSADASKLILSNGRASRLIVENMAGLATLLDAMPPNGALALGTLRAGLPSPVEIVTVKKATTSPAISRSKENLVYEKGQPGVALLDLDLKHLPKTAQNTIGGFGGYMRALEHVCPALGAAGIVWRGSTSAGIRNVETGHEYQGGAHVFISVADVSDSKRFLTAVHKRCWLVGLGWYAIGASGALLERSLADDCVGSPERIVFEANPVLGEGLEQCRKAAIPREGELLDTKQYAALSPSEQRELDALLVAARKEIEPQRKEIQNAWMAVRTKELTKRGMPEGDAAKAAAAWAKGDNLPHETELEFHSDIAPGGTSLIGATVGHVLADPEKYAGIPLADPREGSAYGTQTAKIFVRDNGSVLIRSHAHGGCNYELKHTAASVLAAVVRADGQGKDVIDTFRGLARTAALTKNELTFIARKAAGMCDSVMSDIRGLAMDAVTAARAKDAEAAKEKFKEEASAEGKPAIAPPKQKDPPEPVMQEWSGIMSAVKSPFPPMRTPLDCPAIVYEREPPMGAHLLTNEELDYDD